MDGSARISHPVEVFPHDESAQPRVSNMPCYRAIYYTLSISSRFLMSSMVGNGTIQRCDELMDWWARKIFKSGNAELTTVGNHHLDPTRPYLFMSNHTSILDIPAAYASSSHSIRMVMKKELKNFPIWGQALVASGFVPVSRAGNREEAIKQMAEAKRQLDRGVSIWVYPEGTRSRSGELADFKKGGFHVARDLGMEIVPVWISGTRDAVPADTFKVTYNHKCRVAFGAPVPTEGQEIAQLMDTVRTRMVDLAKPSA